MPPWTSWTAPKTLILVHNIHPFVLHLLEIRSRSFQYDFVASIREKPGSSGIRLSATCVLLDCSWLERFPLQTRQQTGDTTIDHKRHGGWRDLRILKKEVGTDKGNTKDTTLHSHSAKCPGTQNVVPVRLPTMNGFHGALHRIVDVKAARVPCKR
mmetsp:Transcript_10702/g.25675  ORF Transcript_10702/g.25675 Transcript_10702/m.25675 type:complete len:155 (+) Transcript_10702:175-639(+)